jgi:hypothetical protein
MVLLVEEVILGTHAIKLDGSRKKAKHFGLKHSITRMPPFFRILLLGLRDAIHWSFILRCGAAVVNFFPEQFKWSYRLASS